VQAEAIEGSFGEKMSTLRTIGVLNVSNQYKDPHKSNYGSDCNDVPRSGILQGESRVEDSPLCRRGASVPKTTQIKVLHKY
jgi:hypothetical protein